MKKVMFMALIILVSATFTATANDQKGDKKKEKKEYIQPVTDEAVTLVTPSDSISYADGMAASRGLITYLEKTCNFDTLFMADFKRGFLEAIDRGDDPKNVAYNAGLQIGMQVENQILPKERQIFEDTADSLDTQKFYKGFLDGAQNDTTFFTSDTAMMYAEQKKTDITKRKSSAYMNENTEWLEENKKKEGVVTLPSGLQYKVLEQGDGAIATAESNVTVKYEGKMIDGTVFDSSYERNPDTSTFRPDKVIKGWTEALLMMPEGSKWELYIPQELAYGERQAGKIKPYSTLIFNVEVVKVE